MLRRPLHACTAGALAVILGGMQIASAAVATAAAPADREESLRAFTVKDAIELATLAEGAGNRLIRSPDGANFLFVTTKGDLASGARYSKVWRVSRAEGGSFKAISILERPGKSNDDPIASIRWIDNGEAFAFLSPDESDNIQVFRHDLKTGATTQVTHASGSVFSFDMRKGHCIFFASLMRGSAPLAAPGGYLKKESLSRLLFPEEDHLNQLRAAFVQSGAGPAKQITEASASLPLDLVRFAISPDGSKAVAMLPASPPGPNFVAAWGSVKARQKVTIDTFPLVGLQAKLVNLSDGAVSNLISAPTAIVRGDRRASEILWSPTSDAVVISNTLLGPDDLGTSQPFTGASYTVEVQLTPKRTIRILPEDDVGTQGVRVANLVWDDSGRLMVESAAGAGGGIGIASLMTAGHRWRSVYEKVEGNWVRKSREEVDLTPGISVGDVQFSVEESANKPPRILGLASSSGKEVFSFDPNPELQRIRLLPSRAVRWVDSDGHGWSGGIILPDAKARLAGPIPVVIALKSYDPSRFMPDGPFTTAFASQALASKGIAVLEVNAFDAPTMDTEKEGPLQMKGIESAVDFLAKEYKIDPERVGLIGFSRTCYHVAYTLTHSSRRFAAATIADGISGGYVQFVAYSLNHTTGNGVMPLYSALNGGPPWGDTLRNWLERSPDMNMDKVRTPLRIEMLGRSSALQEWEIYSMLKLQGKPVEALYLPDATHVLVKPQERWLSQQGNVNWFTFWLQGGSERDAVNREDYDRWQTMRSASVVSTGKR